MDTSFTVNDPSEIEDILSSMGIDEPDENQTLEKKIVIRDIEEMGEQRSSIAYAQKPMIGVYLEELKHIDKDLDIDNGVYVTGIIDNGGAEDAGMQKGDVIISIDGNRMNSVDDIHDSKASRNPGDQVNIRYIRNGSVMSSNVTLKAKKKAVHTPKRHITYTSGKNFFRRSTKYSGPTFKLENSTSLKREGYTSLVSCMAIVQRLQALKKKM